MTENEIKDAMKEFLNNNQIIPPKHIIIQISDYSTMLKKLVKRMHRIKNFGLTLMQFQHRYATEHGFKKFKDMCDAANEDMIVEAKLLIKNLGE